MSLDEGVLRPRLRGVALIAASLLGRIRPRVRAVIAASRNRERSVGYPRRSRWAYHLTGSACVGSDHSDYPNASIRRTTGIAPWPADDPRLRRDGGCRPMGWSRHDGAAFRPRFARFGHRRPAWRLDARRRHPRGASVLDHLLFPGSTSRRSMAFA